MSMATIEERAIKASEHYKQDIVRFKIPTFPEAYEDGYIQGATEQRKIDVEKACGEFKFFLDRLVEKDIDAFRPEVLREDVKVWLEEFRRAMMED